MLTTIIPRSHASQKRSIHVERSQKVIRLNLILHGQSSSDRSTVVHPDCVGIVLKQNIFATMALPLHEIFASFYQEELIDITKYKDSLAMYRCLKREVT